MSKEEWFVEDDIYYFHLRYHTGTQWRCCSHPDIQQSTIHNCHFRENLASDDGGAIYVKRRSFLNVTTSKFISNKAINSGGSILIQNSHSIISSCTFENESTVEGFGGSVCVENVGNCTIQNCSFIGCKATSGGTVSLISESLLNIKDSRVNHSASVLSGGGFHINHQSVLIGTNLMINNSISYSGGGFSLSESSEARLNNVSFSNNSVNMFGGAIHCDKSSVTFEEGFTEGNTAGQHGGAVYHEYCSGTFDHITFLNNIAYSYGGGIYAKSSVLKTHNTAGEGNDANYMSGMAMITYESKFKSYFMRLKFGERDNLSNNIAIVNKSEAEIHHLNIHLHVKHPVCPLRAYNNSHLVVTSGYYTVDADSKSDHWIGHLSNSSIENACVENAGKLFPF